MSGLAKSASISRKVHILTLIGSQAIAGLMLSVVSASQRPWTMVHGGTSMNYLKLEELKELFRKRPNYKIAQAYLQCLMRYRHMDKIDDETYLDGMEDIKHWMRNPYK